MMMMMVAGGQSAQDFSKTFNPQSGSVKATGGTAATGQ